MLIVGLGESGRAAARFFLARGAAVTATDVRPRPELAAADELAALGVELRLGGNPEALFTAADLIVPSPGVPWKLPQLEAARAAGVRVVGELEIAEAELRGPRVGVTGSNGKTTTTALIAHILAGAGFDAVAAGNIGTPLLAIVDDSGPERWSVLELSSFQLEAMTSFRCSIAVALNVTPDHLDRHGSFEAYARAKQRLFEAQREDDFAVVNADDPVCRVYGSRSKGRAARFSRRPDSPERARVENGWILWDGRKICDVELPIKGSHNLENALAATAAAALAGVSDADVARGLKSFQPVEHRLEFVREIDDVAYYNDSKATNVDATIKAVEAFEGGVWLILGGRDKGGDFSNLIAPLRGRVRGVLLIGEAAPKIRSQLGDEFDVRDRGDLATAVREARSAARPGDTVLLAPACASFDQFADYAERGRAFKRLVREFN